LDDDVLPEDDEKLLPEVVLFVEVELDFAELSPAAMSASSPITGLNRRAIPPHAPGLRPRSLATKETSAAPASQPKKIAIPIREVQFAEEIISQGLYPCLKS